MSNTYQHTDAWYVSITDQHRSKIKEGEKRRGGGGSGRQEGRRSGSRKAADSGCEAAGGMAREVGRVRSMEEIKQKDRSHYQKNDISTRWYFKNG